MNITEELAKLEEMHRKGTLNAEEFAKAKEPVLQGGTTPKQKKPGWLDPRANFRALLGFTAVIGCIWLLIRVTAGPRATSVLTKTVLKSPMTIRDEVQNIPAGSWKALPVVLTYDGNLNISVSVTRGNPVDVRLLDEEDLQKLKAKQDFRHYTPFAAEKTTTYQRNGLLKSGTYHLVLLDKTLGILSSSTTDVKVVAKLSP